MTTLSSLPSDQGSIYDFSMLSLSGDNIAFNRYQGKKMLLVNTASKCGYTPQYEKLEQLHQQHGDIVTLLGFPSNNFLWQEPGSNEQIATFCQEKYGVTFQMFAKINVKGRNAHPLYQWLKRVFNKTPSWNFCKYLLNEQGQMIAFYPSKVDPMDLSIIQKITL